MSINSHLFIKRDNKHIYVFYTFFNDLQNEANKGKVPYNSLLNSCTLLLIVVNNL